MPPNAIFDDISNWISDFPIEVRLSGKLRIGDFKYYIQHNFLEQIKNPLSGVDGFLLETPEEVYKKAVLHTETQQLIKDHNLSHKFLSAHFDDIQIGALVLYNKTEVILPEISNYITVFGSTANDKWRRINRQKFVDLPIIIADDFKQSSVLTNYSKNILSYEEISLFLDDAIESDENTKTMIKAQIFGSNLLSQTGKKSGTFTTIYPSGPGYKNTESDQGHLIRFFEDFYYPFSVSENYLQPLKVNSIFYKRRKVDIKYPKTDWVFFNQSTESAVEVLTNRDRANGIVDGVFVSSKPFVEGPLHTKTEIPLRLDKLKLNPKTVSDNISEIRASIAYYKAMNVKDTVKENDRINIYDEDMLSLAKDLTGEDLIIDYLTRKNLLLDPNIGFGRYENIGRFSSALDKSTGVSKKRSLVSSTTLIGETISNLISDITLSPTTRDAITNIAKRWIEDPVHISEQPFLKLFKDVMSSYGNIVDAPIMIEEYSKKARITFDEAKHIVEQNIETQKQQGYIREVNVGRYSFTPIMMRTH